MQQSHPSALALRDPIRPVQVQPSLGEPQHGGGHVDPDELGVALVPDQVGEQRSGAAAEVEHPGRSAVLQLGQDGPPALLGEWYCCDSRRKFGVLLGVCIGIRVGVRLHRVGCGQVVGDPEGLEPKVRLGGQPTPVGQVAPADQLALGVLDQPSLAGAQQLVDLVRGDPVVLRVVADGQQYVELVERVGEAQRPATSVRST